MNEFQVDFSNLQFLKTSETAPHPNRLNRRCDILLTRNIEAIKGKKILDLASHDGRFSFACLELGAKHVTGVEGRERLVENSNQSFAEMNIDAQKYSFKCADIYDYLPKVEPGTFDTILCFGFFYHTISQVELLKEINRISPKYLILDTTLGDIVYPAGGIKTHPNKLGLITSFLKEKLMNVQKTPSLIFSDENHELESSTINPMNFVARPTIAFIELMFKMHGYQYTRLNWDKSEIKDWTMIKDYKVGKRVSYFVELPGK